MTIYTCHICNRKAEYLEFLLHATSEDEKYCLDIYSCADCHNETVGMIPELRDMIRKEVLDP